MDIAVPDMPLVDRRSCRDLMGIFIADVVLQSAQSAKPHSPQIPFKPRGSYFKAKSKLYFCTPP